MAAAACGMQSFETKCHLCEKSDKEHEPSVSTWILCQGCRLVSYGTKECQEKNLAEHKNICRRIQVIGRLCDARSQKEAGGKLAAELLDAESAVCDVAAGILVYNKFVLNSGTAQAVDPYDRIKQGQVLVELKLSGLLPRNISNWKKGVPKLQTALGVLIKMGLDEESALAQIEGFLQRSGMVTAWQKAFKQLK